MFNYRLVKWMAVVGGWVLSVTLMTVATTDGVTTLRGWSLLVALGAWVPTLALIVEHAVGREHERTARALAKERRRTEALIQAVAVAFAETEVPRIHSDASRGVSL